MHEQYEVADALEETLQTYRELSFPELEERIFTHPRLSSVMRNWGGDRLHDMICYAMGFKRDEKTGKYIPGSRDSRCKQHTFTFLHFFRWVYEEGKLLYLPPDNFALDGPTGQ